MLNRDGRQQRWIRRLRGLRRRPLGWEDSRATGGEGLQDAQAGKAVCGVARGTVEENTATGSRRKRKKKKQRRRSKDEEEYKGSRSPPTGEERDGRTHRREGDKI